MRMELGRLGRALARSGKAPVNAALGSLIIGLFKLVRRTNPDRMADRFGGLMRKLGPWLPEHRIGRANLATAFPEKSAAEIETILAGVWDNLGRVAAEFVHLDQRWFDYIRRLDRTRYESSQQTIDIARRLRDDGKPALVFTAHLANWELPAIIAAAHGIESAVVYRRPNIKAVAEAVQKIRGGSMG